LTATIHRQLRDDDRSDAGFDVQLIEAGELGVVVCENPAEGASQATLPFEAVGGSFGLSATCLPYGTFHAAIPAHARLEAIGAPEPARDVAAVLRALIGMNRRVARASRKIVWISF
jgi:hypothetical protein